VQDSFLQACPARQEAFRFPLLVSEVKIKEAERDLAYDINASKQKQELIRQAMQVEIEKKKKELDELSAVFMNDYSIKHRLVGVGYISKEDAYVLGCVGPMARASGLAMDMRASGMPLTNTWMWSRWWKPGETAMPGAS
jgi:hypothetical protein